MKKGLLSKVDSKVKNIHSCALGVTNLKGGDTVWVQYREHVKQLRYKNITGVCLRSMYKKGDTVCVVRRDIGGIGVEYGFHTLSETVERVRRVRTRMKRGGRSKI